MNRDLCILPLVVFFTTVTSTSIIAAPVISIDLLINEQFDEYTNASPSTDIPVNAGTPVSWIETKDGHTLIGDQFQSYTAEIGSGTTKYTSWLTTDGEGIYQTVSTTPGVMYFLDIIGGVASSGIARTINFTVFDGIGLGGSALASAPIFADPIAFGDGDVRWSYVAGFTATSDNSTMLFTLDEPSAFQSTKEGAGIDAIFVSKVVPSPSASALGLIGLAMVVIFSHRTARKQLTT